jgi:hypothetical protein
MSLEQAYCTVSIGTVIAAFVYGRSRKQQIEEIEDDQGTEDSESR